MNDKHILPLSWDWWKHAISDKNKSCLWAFPCVLLCLVDLYANLSGILIGAQDCREKGSSIP